MEGEGGIEGERMGSSRRGRGRARRRENGAWRGSWGERESKINLAMCICTSPLYFVDIIIYMYIHV